MTPRMWFWLAAYCVVCGAPPMALLAGWHWGWGVAGVCGAVWLYRGMTR